MTRRVLAVVAVAVVVTACASAARVAPGPPRQQAPASLPPGTVRPVPAVPHRQLRLRVRFLPPRLCDGERRVCARYSERGTPTSDHRETMP